MIIAGEELHRFHLDDELLVFARKTGIPVAATILGKSVFPESDPLYLGVYEGAMGRESVRDYVERSDCTIMLGAMMTDMNLGIYTARIDRRHTIYARRATGSPSGSMPMTASTWRTSSPALPRATGRKRDVAALRARRTSRARSRPRTRRCGSRRCSASSTHSSRPTTS